MPIMYCFPLLFLLHQVMALEKRKIFKEKIEELEHFAEKKLNTVVSIAFFTLYNMGCLQAFLPD